MIVAKLNGKELPAKPAVKWFKGKWLELGSKSGARFSFKESHDAASNVRTPWGGEGVGGQGWRLCGARGGECSRRSRLHLGTGCACPRELSGSGMWAPRGQDCPGMGGDSWPFLGELGEW